MFRFSEITSPTVRPGAADAVDMTDGEEGAIIFKINNDNGITGQDAEKDSRTANKIAAARYTETSDTRLREYIVEECVCEVGN